MFSEAPATTVTTVEITTQSPPGMYASTVQHLKSYSAMISSRT